MSRRIALVDSLFEKTGLKVLLSLFNVHSNNIQELRNIKSLNNNELEKSFDSINEDNQQIIFYTAVEQNKVELVRHILEIKPDLINI